MVIHQMGGMASAKLLAECNRIGYEEEHGHSSGYYAEIDKLLYEQIPAKKRIAFSTSEFYKSNNHGRIMGPANYEGKYIFVGAFSRESFRILGSLHHTFVSFRIARNDFCTKMDKGRIYKIAGMYGLNNDQDDSEDTTADHDGQAIVLAAIK